MAKPVSSIASHPDLKSIINKLLDGVPQVQIASRFGVSKQSLSRFKLNTVSKALHRVKIDTPQSDDVDQTLQHRRAKVEAVAIATGTSTSSYVERKLTRYDRILRKAESAGDIAGWASVDKGETQALRLRAELSGELVQQAPSTTVQAIILMPPVVGSDAKLVGTHDNAVKGES